MTGGSLKIMLAAVEPSADAIGASLIRELKTLAPDALLFGCGGPEMRREGLESLFPIEAFSVMGATDVLRVAPPAIAYDDEAKAEPNPGGTCERDGEQLERPVRDDEL